MIDIGAATDNDLAALLEVERQAHLHPWSLSQFATELRLPQSRIDVARDATGLIVGYIVCWLIAGELQVLNVCVAPEKQRQGIARALMRAALERPHERAMLEVRQGNTAAIALYESLGFVRDGERRGYYTGGESAWLYSRTAPL